MVRPTEWLCCEGVSVGVSSGKGEVGWGTNAVNILQAAI
jgi:hypothetical protein